MREKTLPIDVQSPGLEPAIEHNSRSLSLPTRIVRLMGFVVFGSVLAALFGAISIALFVAALVVMSGVFVVVAFMVGGEILADLFESWRAARAREIVTYTPGWTLSRWIEFLFSRKSVDQIFQPIIADMQVEYIDAIAARRYWKARWVAARGYATFWYALVLQVLALALQIFAPLAKVFR